MRRLCPAAVLALAVAWPAGTAAQVPDNRGLRLDPTAPGSPAYEDTVDERDRQRLDDARDAGGTFVPTVRGTLDGDPEPAPAEAPALAPTEADPVTPAAAEDLPPADRLSPVVATESEDALAVQIGVLLETLGQPPQTVRLRYPEVRAAAPSSPSARERRQTAPPAIGAAGMRAGDGLYARVVYGVNSDYPGPVVLEILQPPLAGAVATGKFERVRDRLVVRLDRLEYRGRATVIDAWAVGLDCACYGLAGDVDHHWFERLLLPSAVRFAEGFFVARSEPEQSIRLDDGTVYETSRRTSRQAIYAGAGNAARTAGDILLQDAPTSLTVRIPRNSELAVVFVQAPGAPRIARRRAPDAAADREPGNE